MGVVSRKQTTHIYSEQGTCGCTPLTHLPYLRKSYAQFNILLDSPCCRGKKRPKCENQQFNNQFWPRRARGTYPLFQILMVNLMNLARFKTKINDASLRGSTHQKGTSDSTVGFIIYCNTYLWYHINICTHIYSSELFFFALILILL